MQLQGVDADGHEVASIFVDESRNEGRSYTDKIDFSRLQKDATKFGTLQAIWNPRSANPCLTNFVLPRSFWNYGLIHFSQYTIGDDSAPS